MNSTLTTLGTGGVGRIEHENFDANKLRIARDWFCGTQIRIRREKLSRGKRASIEIKESGDGCQQRAGDRENLQESKRTLTIPKQLEKLVFAGVGFASYFSSSLRALPLALPLVPAKKSEEPPCQIPNFSSCLGISQVMQSTLFFATAQNNKIYHREQKVQERGFA